MTRLLLGGLLIISGILAQGDFNLEDLNPNSDTYGRSLVLMIILVIFVLFFLGMNIEGSAEAGSAF